MSKLFIVMNKDQTEGFVTSDYPLAYEVRKSADTNCYTTEGRHSPVGETFCNEWWEHNCTLIKSDLNTIAAAPEMRDLLKAFIAATEGVFECGHIRTDAMNLIKRIEDEL